MEITSFGDKTPRSYFIIKVEIGVRTVGSAIITLELNMLDYLTNKLQVIKLNYYDLPLMISQDELDFCQN